MPADRLSTDLTKLVSPKAVRNYATALGWQQVPGINHSILVFSNPTNQLRQLIVPLDESFDDYAEAIEEAVRKLAEFEDRPALEVLNHLLLPPADILRFRETGPDTETGTLQLGQAIDLLEGARKMLLSIAHSVLHPQAYHPRLGRGDADQFVRTCRMGQTERGSFVLTIACPIDFVPGTSLATEPFGRKVTEGVAKSISDVSEAIDGNVVDELLDRDRYPLISANFLESLVMLRPTAERASLRMSANWSKALPNPKVATSAKSSIQLSYDSFEAVEYLAPKLRLTAEPKPMSFVGTVDQLRGVEQPDGSMAGEVIFSLQEGGEFFRARAELTPTDYQTAGKAHLMAEPVYFRGFLIRSPRINRIDKVVDFRSLGPLN